jgi:hypothetical protein
MEKIGGHEKLADDLLDGADEIADFMGWPRRRVYYLLENSLIPAFQIGTRWTARKSRLRKHVEELEKGKQQ